MSLETRTRPRHVVLATITVTATRTTPKALLATASVTIPSGYSIAGCLFNGDADLTLAAVADNPTGAPTHGQTLASGAFDGLLCDSILEGFDLSAAGDTTTYVRVLLV